MRRAPKVVKKVWPLFTWQSCDICGADFRRERGWVWLEVARAQWCLRAHYICKACGPTEDKAIHAAFHGPSPQSRCADYEAYLALRAQVEENR